MCKLLGWSRCLNITAIYVYLVSRGVLGCWLPTAIVIAGHVILSLCKCGPGLCERGLHPIRELIHSFQSGWWRGFKAHVWVLSRVQEERCLLSAGVDMVVVLEFRHGQKFIPVILALIDKDPEVLFQFLVDTFCLSIHLWVVRCGC